MLNKYKAKIKHDKGHINITTLAEDIETAKAMICRSEKCPETAIVKIKEVVFDCRAKHYLIVRSTGKSCYSTHVRGFMIKNNQITLIEELHGQGEDNCLRYLHDIIKKRGSKIDIVKLYRLNKITIQELTI